MKFELPKLDYAYDALEPHIDALTMETHHSKHHQAYTNNFNAALNGLEEIVKGLSAEAIITNVDMIPSDKRQAIINNGGGYINHILYFDILGPSHHAFAGEVSEAIKKQFGSFETFKDELSKAATTQFGSGWAWLVVDQKGQLSIMKTSNQDSPLTQSYTPIIGLDVWEHAYYLKYQNRRPEYIEQFFEVIDWDKVNRRYLKAIKKD